MWQFVQYIKFLCTRNSSQMAALQCLLHQKYLAEIAEINDGDNGGNMSTPEIFKMFHIWPWVYNNTTIMIIILHLITLYRFRLFARSMKWVLLLIYPLIGKIPMQWLNIERSCGVKVIELYHEEVKFSKHHFFWYCVCWTMLKVYQIMGWAVFFPVFQKNDYMYSWIMM